MKNTLTEARLQFLAGIINESEYLNQIGEEVSPATPEAVAQTIGPELKDFVGDLEDAFQDAAETKSEGIATAAGLVLAIPAILGLIAKVGSFASSTIKKMFGDKPNDASAAQAYFEKIGALADDLHHLYVQPIEFVVKKFVKDPNKAKSISNAIFHIIVATMLIASGTQALSALKSKKITLATLESALTAVKGGEVKAYLTKLF
jgi:hypothetical protein